MVCEWNRDSNLNPDYLSSAGLGLEGRDCTSARWCALFEVKKVKKLPAGGAAAQAKLDRAKYETHWTGSDSIFISQQRMTFDK